MSQPRTQDFEKHPFAPKGSQHWLQVAVAHAPHLLDESFRRAGVIAEDDTVEWLSPVAATRFAEYRDGEALRRLGVDPNTLPHAKLAEFWPSRGPVWDGLGRSARGKLILVEAKAHVREAASPASRATGASLALIRKSLAEARAHYAPGATVDWSGVYYQYANRLAFHYLFSRLNDLPTRLVFLDFVNASDVLRPETEDGWRENTRSIHDALGLPDTLEEHGVFHAYVDAPAVAASHTGALTPPRL